MKYMKFYTLLAICLIMLPISAQQPAWSLEDCINYAHANNLRVKQKQLEANIAENDLLQSKIQILPDVNASFSRDYAFGYQVNEYTNDFISQKTMNDRYGLSATVNLFAGLRTYNAIKANEFNSLAKIQDVEKEKVNISIEIASAYLTILFSKELLEVAKSSRDVAALQVERTAKLVEAGSVARGNLLEIKAQLSAEDLNVALRENEYNVAVLNLTQLLDLKSTADFSIIIPTITEPDFALPVVGVATVYNDGLTYLPHVKAAEYNLMMNEKVLDIRKGQYSPSLSLYSGWYTGYSDGYFDNQGDLYSYGDQLEILSSKSIGLRLSVPIFTRYQTRTTVQNAKISVLSSQTTVDQVKQALYKEIQQAYNDAYSASEKYKNADEAVKSYQEAFVYTEQKFNVGMVNSVEYNISKNNYIKAQSELLQAKYQYVFSIKILDFYRGIPITL